MSARCDLAFDASEIVETLAGEHGAREREAARIHAEQCAACRAVVRTRAVARATWKAAIAKDDMLTRAASERRLVSGLPPRRARVAPARSFALGVAFTSVVALAAIFARGGRGGSPWLSKVEHGWPAFRVVSSASASAPVAPSSDAAPPARPVALTARRAVVASTCAGCRVAGAPVSAGMDVPPGERITVPGGARIVLGFAFGEGLVDPRAGAEVEGPAVASAATDGTLSVERGRADVRASHEVAVDVPGGRIVAEHATYTLRVDEHGRVRVTVTSGSVRLLQRSPVREHVLTAGESGTLPEVEPAASVVPPPAPAPRAELVTPAVVHLPPAAASAPTIDHEARVARARAGDPAARLELQHLAGGPESPAARRAAFALAELELATGDKGSAQARLALLFTAPEASLGFDAATLYAHTQPSAPARAEAWRRYLATSPREPYRVRALLARAEALVDGGDTFRRPEIEAILGEVAAAATNEPLPEREARQLERIRHRLRERR